MIVVIDWSVCISMMCMAAYMTGAAGRRHGLQLAQPLCIRSAATGRLSAGVRGVTRMSKGM